MRLQAAACRIQASCWRPAYWGYGHLALDCRAWALGKTFPVAAPKAAATWRLVCPAVGAWAASLCARQTTRTRDAWANCQCVGQTKRTRSAWADSRVRNIIIFIIINKFKRKYYY